ncbi:GspE/PulE family protein [Parachitinimonas caeni]|uniref:ATPase, T2SS/T4P/T4SS family n=1 Tax=Parachitinimonas caeni TaxID=3031301 RepID=A0ABT7E3U1_9NEIS|nr:ATPase, T2SS/T4P/T4SS family [Parachitinimonas caeni]MDK2126714.1 ATPase, T2SS/T4P/T4SS family [Parachitinimonas caeni]
MDSVIELEPDIAPPVPDTLTPLVTDRIPSPAAKMKEITARRIDYLTDVPDHQAVLTGPGGLFPLPGDSINELSALQIDARSVWLLVTDGRGASQATLTLRGRLESAGLHIACHLPASTSVIQALNIGERARSQTLPVHSNAQTLFYELICDTMRHQATDLHLCIRGSSGRALIRQHTRVVSMRQVSGQQLVGVCHAVFNTMSQADSQSQNQFSPDSKSLDTVLEIDANDQRVKLRFQWVKTFDGGDAVFRVLPMASGREVVDTSHSKVPSLADLGYAPSHVELLELGSARNSGLIAVCGVTGSGKSTTIRTLLSTDPDRASRKRYSLEDPVEYKIYGVSQIAVKRAHAGDDSEMLAMANALLRADPDDVMLGEVRTREMGQTLELMVLSGHRVYTTLHTASAFGAIKRLGSDVIGIKREVLSDPNFLSLLIYQALLPTLCPHCKQPAADQLGDKLDAQLRRFGLDPARLFVEKPGGCGQCQGLGVAGQTVAAEVVVPTAPMRRLIEAGKLGEAETLWRQSRRTGFDHPDMTGKTAFEHALYKVAQGLVDPREAQRPFAPYALHEIVEPTGGRLS